MGDSSPEKMKSNKKMKRVSNNSLNPEEIKEGDFTPALVRSSFPVASNTDEGTSSSSSLTKKLILWGKELFGEKISCFVVDISMDHLKLKPTIESAFDHQIIHTGEKLTHSTPIFSFPLESTHVPLFSNTFATLGSFLYSFGGLFSRPRDNTSGTNLVHYFDPLTPENGSWKPSPPMITPRQNPQVIIANRDIYVFGCFGSDKCPHDPGCVWAEGFDSSTCEWTPLPLPPFRQNLIVCSSIPRNKNHPIKKISALIDHGIFYEFRIETNSWVCVANYEKNLSGIIHHPTMVNKVFYWFGECVHAYEILKDRNFEGPVQDMSFHRAMRHPVSADSEDDDGIRPAIIHLGGRYFCVLGSLPDLDEHAPMRIHCLVIKVSKTNDCYKLYHGDRRDTSAFFLGARVIACHSFTIDRPLDFLDGRLMMI